MSLTNIRMNDVSYDEEKEEEERSRWLLKSSNNVTEIYRKFIPNSKIQLKPEMAQKPSQIASGPHTLTSGGLNASAKTDQSLKIPQFNRRWSKVYNLRVCSNEFSPINDAKSWLLRAPVDVLRPNLHKIKLKRTTHKGRYVLRTCFQSQYHQSTYKSSIALRMNQQFQTSIRPRKTTTIVKVSHLVNQVTLFKEIFQRVSEDYHIFTRTPMHAKLLCQ